MKPSSQSMGGYARAQVLSAEERKRIARDAALARWSKEGREMRPGGGHAKGSAFERKVCKTLSLWLSGGQYERLFNRNVLSGGSFTVATQKGRDETGQPGDLAAAHPLAYQFLQHFLIECKHKKSLNLTSYLHDYSGASFLAKTFALARKQAGHRREPLIIAAENHRPALLLMRAGVGQAAIRTAPVGKLHYHLVHNETIMMLALQEFIDHVPPDRFLRWYTLPEWMHEL